MTNWSMFWGEHVYVLLWSLGALAALVILLLGIMWKLVQFIWSGQQTQVTHCLSNIKKDLDEMVADSKACRVEALHCREGLARTFADKGETHQSLKRLFERQDELRRDLPKEYVPKPDFDRIFSDLKDQIKELKGCVDQVKRGVDFLKTNGKIK